MSGGTGRGLRGWLAAAIELAVPLECGGCRRAGVGWCAPCRAAFDDGPEPVRPRLDPQVPLWTMGRYAGPRREVVLAAKEHGRTDLIRDLGALLALGLARLREDGQIAPAALAPLVLVPAPTRRAAARRRGGDPVRRIAEAAAHTTAEVFGARPRVWPALETAPGAADSVGLGARERDENLRGRVRLARRAGPNPSAGAEVVLVDDVVTTGATMAESVRVLAARGVPVRAGLTLVRA